MASFADTAESLYGRATRVQYCKPKGQLELSERELVEEIQRNLSARDPNVVPNQVQFSYRDFAYERQPPGAHSNLAVHFSMDGNCMFYDSEEAEEQRRRIQRKLVEEKARKTGAAKPDDALWAGLPTAGDAEKADKDQMFGLNNTALDTEELDDGTQKNQFNFSDRACQTPSTPYRELQVTTVPTATDTFAFTFTQWEMYDHYMACLQREHRAALVVNRNKKRRVSSGTADTVPVGGMGAGAGSNAAEDAQEQELQDPMTSAAMDKALRVIERMVNQNRENDVYLDFKYWEDESDAYRNGKGSMLPLWRFTTDDAKYKHVTCMRWHPVFEDLFAVGYGSFDFLRQSTGMVYCYSLKNTAFPEVILNTEAGVTALDWHPQHKSLLCAGCYDGSVLVFDVNKKEKVAIFESTVKTGKHTDPVWEVHWQDEEVSKHLNFFSISTDGRVANWFLTNTGLKMEVLMELKMDIKANSAGGPRSPGKSSGGDLAATDGDVAESTTRGLALGCTFDFNRTHDHLFLVGSEEGDIYKCSKAYSGQYLSRYTGHNMAVYRTKWNSFHPDVFISCSCDWTVKVWHQSLTEVAFTFQPSADKPKIFVSAMHPNPHDPLIVVDLDDIVADVAWAPYSSTVFATITNDGRVQVFDLEVNKHEPICIQKVVKRSKPTKIAFNSVQPIVIIGDDHGSVVALKLSPNLRKGWVSGTRITSAPTAAEPATNDTDTPSKPKVTSSLTVGGYVYSANQVTEQKEKLDGIIKSMDVKVLKSMKNQEAQTLDLSTGTNPAIAVGTK